MITTNSKYVATVVPNIPTRFRLIARRLAGDSGHGGAIQGQGQVHNRLAHPTAPAARPEVVRHGGATARGGEELQLTMAYREKGTPAEN